MDGSGQAQQTAQQQEKAKKEAELREKMKKENVKLGGENTLMDKVLKK